MSLGESWWSLGGPGTSMGTCGPCDGERGPDLSPNNSPLSSICQLEWASVCATQKERERERVGVPV